MTDTTPKEPGEGTQPNWLDGLTHKDWLFDGAPIRGRVMIERFDNLDWLNAWVDLGPSPAGNIGPYWHVPLKETIIDGEVYDLGDTVHRLYPKVLQTKWMRLIHQACKECKSKSATPSNAWGYCTSRTHMLLVGGAGDES